MYNFIEDVKRLEDLQHATNILKEEIKQKVMTDPALRLYVKVDWAALKHDAARNGIRI